MNLSNKWYDRLKWVAQILLPAVATLVFALAQVWQIPYTEQIVGTITAIDCFLGALLGISTRTYNRQMGLMRDRLADASMAAKAGAPADYKERMKIEYRQTADRYGKLCDMLYKLREGTPDFAPTCSEELLKRQRDAMNEYLCALEERAEIEGVDLREVDDNG